MCKSKKTRVPITHNVCDFLFHGFPCKPTFNIDLTVSANYGFQPIDKLQFILV